MENTYTPEKAKSKAHSIENTFGKRKEFNFETHSSDSDYLSKAYPEGYGSNLSNTTSKLSKIPAEKEALSMFDHKGAGYWSLNPVNVKTSSISDENKTELRKLAHYGWEIRPEEDGEGEQRYYFVLREDIQF